MRSARQGAVYLLTATVIILTVGVFVYHRALGLSWIDATYFMVTTITTVGYGDISLVEAPAWVKVFGSVLMVAGAALLAALFAIVTDTLLSTRLQEILGVTRRRPMKDHFIVCGLGNVGYRVIEYLVKLDLKVTVIEKREEGQFVPEIQAHARRTGVRLIFGDIRSPATLEEANVATAQCLLAVSDHDLSNLEAALNARAANSDIRLVLRMFDQNLASKICDAFTVESAFSTSALAAPAFAMAAVDPSVVGCFYVGKDLMLNLDLTVCAGSKLDGMSSIELLDRFDVSILAHVCGQTGRRMLHVSDPLTLAADDHLVVSTLPDEAKQIHRLNAPR